MGPNLVRSDAANFPEPSMVPAGQSTDKVCGEVPRLAIEKEDVENDASMRSSLGFVGGILRSSFRKAPKAPEALLMR